LPGEDTLAFAPDGNQLATTTDFKIEIHDCSQTGGPVERCGEHDSLVNDLAFDPKGVYIASASGAIRPAQGEIRLWNRAEMKASVLKHHAAPVTSLVFLPGSPLRLASGSRDRTVKVWNVEARREEHSLFHGAEVTRVLATAEGQLISAGFDGKIHVWDLQTGKGLRTFDTGQKAVLDIALHPDGQRLASAGFDHTIKIWDPRTGDLKRTLRGHRGPVAGICFDPHGDRLASCSGDETVKIWDVMTGEELLTLPARLGSLKRVVFSPQGTRLAAVGSQRRVRIWEAPRP
jgi:WD40 repeat protein